MLVLDAPTLPLDVARPSLEAVLAAVSPGSTAIWERDRAPGVGGSTDLARYRRLLDLREITRRHGAPLIVGGRVDLALAAGADGVQLKERGLDAALTRARWPGLWIGRSCHDRAGLERAQRGGADWATLSPVRAPFSKAASGPPLGVDGFAAAIIGLDLPVVGLGGVDGAVAKALSAVGARAVATLGGVLGRPDAVARARALLSARGGDRQARL